MPSNSIALQSINTIELRIKTDSKTQSINSKMEITTLRQRPTFKTMTHLKSYPMNLNLTGEKPKINKHLSFTQLKGEEFAFEPCDEEIADITKGPSEILDFIYLGSEEHSSNSKQLKENNITHILNVAKGCKNHFEDEITYKNLQIFDNCEEDITQIFEEAFEFIERVRMEGGRVLVHCHAGISRSATIVTAYIMKTQGLSVDEALKIVKERRKCAAPNFGFMLKLMNFESTVKKQA